MKNSKYVCTKLAVWCLYVQQHCQSNQICSRVSHETHKYEWNFMLKGENLLPTLTCTIACKIQGWVGWSLSFHVFNNKKHWNNEIKRDDYESDHKHIKSWNYFCLWFFKLYIVFSSLICFFSLSFFLFLFKVQLLHSL